MPREPAPLGEALGEVLRRDGIELVLGRTRPPPAATARTTSCELDDGRELRGDRLLVATGRRPRVEGIGLETVGVEADAHGIPVDAHMRAGERLWAIGDVTGIWPLTHVGKYQGDVVAANILGEPREAQLRGRAAGHLHRPAGRRGRRDRGARSARPRRCRRSPKTATYTHAYAESNGFLTLLSDGERLTGAYALGPEAGEWLQQATLAIRARVPLDVLRRHDPALPDLLGDLRRGAEGAPRRDRGSARAGRRGIAALAEPMTTAVAAPSTSASRSCSGRPSS